MRTRQIRLSGLFFAILLAISGTVELPAIADEAEGPVQSRLDELKEQSESQVPADLLEAGRKGTEELMASGILERAHKTGDAMQAFTLEDAHGNSVSSKQLLSEGPR